MHIALYFRTPPLQLTKGLQKGSMSTKQNHSISSKNDFILRQISTCFITVIYAVTRNHGELCVLVSFPIDTEMTYNAAQ